MVKRNSGIIGPLQNTTSSVGGAKGCHESFDQYNAEKGGNWPSVVIPGTNTQTSFYGGLPTRTYYDSSSSDTTAAFDCKQVQTQFSGTGRLYIGIKVTNSTTYYNDISIGGIQILSSDQSTINQSWFFTSSSGGTGSTWKTYTSQITGSSSYGFPVTPYTASGYTYSNISTSTGVGQFSWATSTGSYNTGTAGGISSSAWTSTPMTLGNGQISQVGSNYYAYRETSGSTRYSGTIMRSPSRTWAGSEWIRIAFLIVSPSSPATNYADSLFVGTY